MTGFAAWAAAGASASESRQMSESSRERKGIARERVEGPGPAMAGTAGIGTSACRLKLLQAAARADLDRVEGSRPPISDRVTVCGPPVRPYRSDSVQVRRGILRSLTVAGVPSSITTYRWPVTRM